MNEYIIIILLILSIVWSTVRNRVLIGEVQHHSARRVMDETINLGMQLVPKLLTAVPQDIVQSFGRSLLRTMATELFPRPRAGRSKKGDGIPLGEDAPWWAPFLANMMNQPKAPKKPEKESVN